MHDALVCFQLRAVGRHTTKDGKLIRRLSSHTKPTFYSCTVFGSHSHLQRVHTTVAGPLTTALHTTEREGKQDATSIVYYLYGLAARWTTHAKIDSWGILAIVFIIFDTTVLSTFPIDCN